MEASDNNEDPRAALRQKIADMRNQRTNGTSAKKLQKEIKSAKADAKAARQHVDSAASAQSDMRTDFTQEIMRRAMQNQPDAPPNIKMDPLNDADSSSASASSDEEEEDERQLPKPPLMQPVADNDGSLSSASVSSDELDIDD